MDLDDFEIAVTADLPVPEVHSFCDAISAFDALWFSARTRAARWMDLIGDYAGMERFVIDGEHIRAIALQNLNRLKAML